MSALIAVTSFLAASPSAFAAPVIPTPVKPSMGYPTGVTPSVVDAGTTAQLATTQLTIGNTFVNGDTIDLTLSKPTDATFNSPSTSVGFASLPNVSIAALKGNDNANVPTFTTQLVSSPTAGGVAKDVLRITMTRKSIPDTTGTSTNDGWVFTIGGATVNVGSALVPGGIELTATSSNTDLVAGQEAKDPAFVSAVTTSVAGGSLVADGTTQKVGDVTIAETNKSGLVGGTYTFDVTGTGLSIDQNSPVSVSITNPGTGETVSKQATFVNANEISFDLNETAPNTGADTKATITLSGLAVDTTKNQPAKVTYSLAGKNLDTDRQDTATGDSVSRDAYGLEATAKATPLAARLFGLNRYATAAAIARAYPEHVAVLASGENFPDALSSTYLAGVEGANTLLTHADSIPADTLDVLGQNGVYRVYVVGGTGAVSNAVVNQLKDRGMDVIRLGGADRFATNKAVNSFAVSAAGGVGRTAFAYGQPSKATAIVANGLSAADALAAGPATAGSGGGFLPLILTKGDTLSSSAADQLNGMGIQKAIIAGGVGAVSSDVQSSIEAITGGSAKRLGGSDRYGTAVEIAKFETTQVAAKQDSNGNWMDGGLGWTTTPGVFLANGDGAWGPDALAAGSEAGKFKMPILLTRANTLADATDSYLKSDAANQFNLVTALGGAGAVANSVLQQAQADLKN